MWTGYHAFFLTKLLLHFLRNSNVFPFVYSFFLLIKDSDFNSVDGDLIQFFIITTLPFSRVLLFYNMINRGHLNVFGWNVRIINYVNRAHTILQSIFCISHHSEAQFVLHYVYSNPVWSVAQSKVSHRITCSYITFGRPKTRAAYSSSYNLSYFSLQKMSFSL